MACCAYRTIAEPFLEQVGVEFMPIRRGLQRDVACLSLEIEQSWRNDGRQVAAASSNSASLRVFQRPVQHPAKGCLKSRGQLPILMRRGFAECATD